MMIHRNVRERRQQRIRMIMQEQGRSEPGAIREHSGRGQDGVRREDRFFHGPVEPARHGVGQDERWSDPEYVWKQQQRLLTRGENGDRPPFGGLAGLFLFQLVASAVLFAAVWGLFQLNQPWAVKAQAILRSAMQSEFDFQALEAWYKRHFAGFPSFIPAWQGGSEALPIENVHSANVRSLRPPISGQIVQPYSPDFPGVLIESRVPAQVANIDTGRVIYVGETKQTGLTVIIQHGHELLSLYGRLSSAAVEKDDWVEAGEPIGTLEAPAGKSSGLLYFSIKRGGEYLNPADVMKFE